MCFIQLKGWRPPRRSRSTGTALLVPEIMIEGFDYDAEEVLRPAFVAVWRAAGWEEVD